MHCQKCGKENSKEAKFCTSCGAQINRDNEAKQNHQQNTQLTGKPNKRKWLSTKTFLIGAVLCYFIAWAIGWNQNVISDILKIVGLGSIILAIIYLWRGKK